MAPDSKQLTIAYAAGASLAAITLVYVFGPTFFIDGTGANASSSQRKRTVVGLYNPANDCFVNSVLQSLAGLAELRLYLVKRVMLQAELEEQAGEQYKYFKGRRPLLTAALKQVLDKLNERPIYKKTISAREFLNELEKIFRQKVSRTQQDAQEFLQIVAQTIAEENHAQVKLERFVQEIKSGRVFNGEEISTTSDQEKKNENKDQTVPNGVRMPMEGEFSSSIECQACRFTPKPRVSQFVALTLNVPQVNSTTLDKCLNDLFSTEYMDDFQCEKCVLISSIQLLSQQHTTTSGSQATQLAETITRLKQCLVEDPEKVPEDIKLPAQAKDSVKSRIARRTYLSTCPEILAIHLSRSIYDIHSRKNSCKISFPEFMSLGPVLERQRYKLLAVVTHKGGHESGHYECFRRQIVHPPPYSTPVGRLNPRVSHTASSYRSSSQQEDSTSNSSPISASSTEDPDNPLRSTVKSVQSVSSHPNGSAKQYYINPVTQSPSKMSDKFRRKTSNRWWRISDEKIKETSTSDVLSFQKEVYLLFYERERPEVV